MQTPLPAPEKLGVLLQGMGAVGSTFIAGVLATRQGLGSPIGSLTQMGLIGASDLNVGHYSLDYIKSMFISP